MKPSLGTALALALLACRSTTVDLGGNTAAPTTIVSPQMQLIPLRLASDGTTLFWANRGAQTGGPILSMPVAGGPISTLVGGNLASDFLAVDDTYVYYHGPTGLERVRKNGGGLPTTVVPIPVGFAVQGDRVYWIDAPPSPLGPYAVSLKSTPLQGGTVSTIATFQTMNSSGVALLGVTATMGFITGLTSQPQLNFFALSGVGLSDGGVPPVVPGIDGCQFMISDTSAGYCLGLPADASTGAPDDGTIVRVSDDGSTTNLGNDMGYGFSAGSGGVAVDDSYVYWANSLSDGAILKAPKTGGGEAVTIAHDTQPLAVAVDANAVYWSDEAGNIMRLAK